MTRTIREKVISARTSAVTGTAKALHVLLVGGHALDEFEELLVYLDVNTALVGTTPTMDIYLQRAVTDTPDEDTDADWDDLMSFAQVTTSLTELVAHLPVVNISPTNDDEKASIDHVRGNAGVTASVAKLGHWGDRIRVVEKMGGTVTTSAVYDLTLVGTLRTEE